jgi:predicted HD superfamily hydrolase involved in NAD metabolism
MTCTPERVRAVLQRYVGARRRAHSESVARLAADLCRRFGEEPLYGIIAGLAHDVAREMPESQLLSLVRRDGGGISAGELGRPVLLHGRAAAVVLRREVEGCPPEVYAALADHVTGRPGMSRLARILYVADYLEPERGFLDTEERSAILGLELDHMVLTVLERVISYLEKKGVPVAEEALSLYRELGEHADAQTKMG